MLQAYGISTLQTEIASSANQAVELHKEALRAEFPDFSNRIFMLSEMIDQTFDVADPIGRPLSDYEKTAIEIERLISSGFNRIQELVKKDPLDNSPYE